MGGDSRNVRASSLLPRELANDRLLPSKAFAFLTIGLGCGWNAFSRRDLEFRYSNWTPAAPTKPNAFKALYPAVRIPA